VEVVPNVVQEVKLDPQDPQETTVNQANQVLPETQDKVEDLQFKHANKLLHHHVTHVPLDHQDHQAAQESQEMPDQMVTQDKEAATRNQDLLDLKDPRDHQDQTEIQAAQDSPEPQLKARKQDQEPQDQQEIPAHQDHQDQPDNLDNQEAQVNQEAKDQAVNQEPQEMMDSQVNPDPPVNQEAPVKRVSARNTALSMVESSSKMEHADVKSRSFKTHTRGDLPKTPCPMNQQFPFLLLVAQKTAIYYVSLYCIQDWGFLRSLFFLK